MRNPVLTLGVACAVISVIAASDNAEGHTSISSQPNIPADTMATMYDVGGVTVIQRRNPASEIAAVRIHLLGGSRQVDAATAGVEPVMLIASEYGTKSYPGETARKAISRTGSAVGISPNADWTSVDFIGLAEDFDSTFAVVSDRLVHPTLDHDCRAARTGNGARPGGRSGRHRSTDG